MRTCIATLAVVLTMSLWAAPSFAQRGGPGRPGPGHGGDNNNPWDWGRHDETIVGKFIKAEKTTLGGRQVMAASLSPMAGEGTKVVAVPNKDPMSTTYDPDPAQMGVITKLEKGDLVQVKGFRFREVLWIREVSKYQLKPGEDEPNCFLFEGSGESYVDKEKFTSIAISRFGEKEDVLVPKKKGENGQTVDDPKLTEVIGKLSQGDVVEATASKSDGRLILKSIAKYVAPTRAEVVKVVDELATKDSLAIEVKINGASQTLQVPAADDRLTHLDPKLSALVKSFKPGDAVEVRTRSENGKTYLVTLARAKPEPKK